MKRDGAEGLLVTMSSHAMQLVIAAWTNGR